MNAYPTSIAIGGALPAAALPRLLAAASADGVALDWNAASLTEDPRGLDLLAEGVADAAGEGRPLRLYDDAATGGTLDHVELFCRENGLSYRRGQDPDNGESGEVTWWAPGMAKPASQPADADGEPMAYVSALVEALARGSAASRLAAVQAVVDQASPCPVPTLDLQG
jgi:hypothetical protein